MSTDWTLVWTAAGSIATVTGVGAAMVAGFVAWEQLRVAHDQGLIDAIVQLDGLLSHINDAAPTNRLTAIGNHVTKWNGQGWIKEYPDAPGAESLLQIFANPNKYYDRDLVAGNIYLKDLIKDDQDFQAWMGDHKEATPDDVYNRTVQLIVDYRSAINTELNTFESIARIRKHAKSSEIQNMIDDEYRSSIESGWFAFKSFSDESTICNNSSDPFPTLSELFGKCWNPSGPPPSVGRRSTLRSFFTVWRNLSGIRE